MTNDLSVGLRTPLQEAEQLKYRYGGALASLIKENHIIEVPTVGDRKARKVSQKVLVEILEARIEEILQVVNKKICGSGYRNRINAGMVITGGTALLANIVELADSQALFEHPLHPYSEALLSAVPRTDPDHVKRRITLQGDVPSPANPPSGCKFHPRCRYAQDICKQQPPEWRELQPDHWAACHLAETLQLEGISA